MMVLANTVPGHGDVPVADSYRRDNADHYQAALESLQARVSGLWAHFQVNSRTALNDIDVIQDRHRSKGQKPVGTRQSD